MRRLEFLKGVAALTVLATAYNNIFDVVEIAKGYEFNLALSFLCAFLFLAGIYHDKLSREVLKQAQNEGYQSYPVSRDGIRDLIFREGLLSFLFLIPVVPALHSFPTQPQLGLSLFLFPLHGAVRIFRSQKMKGTELVIGPDRIAYTLRSTRSVHYEDLDRVAVKYEYVYFILKNERVETLPLEFLPENKKDILGHLAERLKANGVKGGNAVQELADPANSSE